MTDPAPASTKRKRRSADDDLGLGETSVGTNRADTKRLQAEALEKKKQEVVAKRARLEEQQKQERAAQPVSPTGTHGDRNFYARFIQVGQGDCIVFCTPQGRRVLVDCGAKPSEVDEADFFRKRTHASLKDDKFLGPKQVLGVPVPRRIDVLILTHPDADHYNKLKSVLGRRGITIGRVYHSGQLAQYGPATSTWIRASVEDEVMIRKVVHNKERGPDGALDTGPGMITLGGAPVLPQADASSVDCLDTLGGIRIIAETDPFCAVTILAAGVDTDYALDKSDGDGKNRASIVTLVEVFDGAARRKLLLCGDATTSTEQYLITHGRWAAENRARLAGVDVAHVAHHGSVRTSSGAAFVNLVAPKARAVVCAGQQGLPSHHLPSWVVIRRWAARMATSAPATLEHPLWAWNLDTNLHFTVQETVTAPIYTTGSDGDQKIDWLRP